MRVLRAVGLLVCLGGLSTPGCTGCTGEQARPTGTARLFLRALAAADAEEVYRLLAPSTRQHLDTLARLATDQTGGRKKIKPQDLLIPGMNQLPTTKPLVVEEKPKVQGDRADVRLMDQAGKLRLVLRLERVGRRWQVVLPPRLLQPPEAGPPMSPTSPTSPTSRPTSRPAR